MDEHLHPITVGSYMRYVTDEEAADLWGLGFIGMSREGEWFAKASVEEVDTALKGLRT